MNIKTATFLTSAKTLETCPDSDLQEFAFIGRSNVGKSSLLNMLAAKKDLAKVSATPGHTQLINFFTMNEAWTLVDLPGYGYAKTPKTERARFQQMIIDYLTKRPNLRCVFVLIDSRHEPQAIDLEFVNWLLSKRVRMVLVFTKSDKLKPTPLKKNIDLFLESMAEWCDVAPKVFVTSSKSREGRLDMLGFIAKVLKGE